MVSCPHDFSQFRDLGVEHECHLNLLKPGFFKDIKVDLSKLSCDIWGELFWTGRQGFSCIGRCSDPRNPQNHRACPEKGWRFWSTPSFKSPSEASCYVSLGGGFQHFLFSSLFGKDSHFDSYFSTGLKPPTSSYCHVSMLEQREVDRTPCCTAEI